jgi:7-keto-8-aminopelargonate synthetase-like enzyme
MNTNNSFYDTVNQIVSYGAQKGILHLYNEEDRFDGNQIVLKGRPVVNFGSCSYLGLEFDPRLKNGAKEAIDQYGTQFSESRAYVSLRLYKDLEILLQKLFNAHCVVTPTTTLGHIANIPVLVNDGDAVIMDHQVHNSVQTAVNIIKGRGVHVELLRHNRMDLLEERIKILRAKHRKIWYMADGIYSMFGDGAPLADIYSLLDKYPEFHFYVDDAHGMSIYGKNGRGFVLNNRGLHPRMAMATSLNKAFAAGGGVLLYHDPDLARKVRTCGGPLITSGPMQPATLGAAVASARIHLSDEIHEMQTDLWDKIRFTKLMLKKYGLPTVSEADASVFFVGVSLPKLGYNLVARMLKEGYYLNLGIFPAVPMKKTGIRFTITRLHTYTQIEMMIATLAAEYPKALEEEDMTLAQVYKAFKLTKPEELMQELSITSMLKQTLSLEVEHYDHIHEIDKELWNGLFEGRGTFDWDGLRTLEDSFSDNARPEDNWQFDYFLIRDRSGKVVVATFFTMALWKDDMLHSAGISQEIEQVRERDPYYLTSKVVASGTLLTEGEHVYIDKTSHLWKDAMQILFGKIFELQDKYKANSAVLRDFHGLDKEMDDLLVENGFFRFSMPETSRVKSIGWKDAAGMYRALSANSKKHFRKYVLRHEARFTVNISSGPVADNQVGHWYGLYQNVKRHSLELNTFDLPEKLFRQLLLNGRWEVLTLRLNEVPGKDICMVLCYKTNDCYIPMVIGLDYRYNRQFSVYRQALYQLALRAAQLGKKSLQLGFDAAIEKRKLGAITIPVYAYMNTKDSYNMEVLSGINQMNRSLKHQGD